MKKADVHIDTGAIETALDVRRMYVRKLIDKLFEFAMHGNLKAAQTLLEVAMITGSRGAELKLPTDATAIDSRDIDMRKLSTEDLETIAAIAKRASKN